MSVRNTVCSLVVLTGMVTALLPQLSSSGALAATENVSIVTTNLGFSGVPGPAADFGFGFVVSEGRHGDLNGDGDTSDFVAHVWDAATGASANLGLAAEQTGAAAAWGFSFLVPEFGQGPGGTDLRR